MKINNKYYICLLYVLLNVNSQVIAQNIEKVCDVHISNIDNATVDNTGNIFLCNTNGDIIKYNKLCKEQLIYSPNKTGKIKNISIWSQFKVFAFYEEFQEYIILNRFLTSPVRYGFSNIEIGYISSAILNFQQNIWVIDESDFSLKLIDSQQGNIITSQQLNQYLDISNHQITDMIEYKGKLYIIDESSGILIFDSFGNYINQIKGTGFKNLLLDNHTLSYQSSKRIIALDLNTQSQDTTVFTKGGYSTVFKKNDTFYAISNDELEIYQYLRNE